jgi:hypothetical protein
MPKIKDVNHFIKRTYNSNKGKGHSPLYSIPLVPAGEMRIYDIGDKLEHPFLDMA